MSKPAEVFLNIPYDISYGRLCLAYVVAISAFGLVPRATLDLPAGQRIDRILRLIRSCQFSIHDLSWVKVDFPAPATPRFNMPFELGMAVAHQKSGNNHGWFVFEALDRRVMKSLSDLNGIDVFVHGATIEGVFRTVCNAFVRESAQQPTVPQMWKIYRQLRRALPSILALSSSQSIYSARAFNDVCAAASALADEIVLNG